VPVAAGGEIPRAIKLQLYIRGTASKLFLHKPNNRVCQTVEEEARKHINQQCDYKATMRNRKFCAKARFIEEMRVYPKSACSFARIPQLVKKLCSKYLVNIPDMHG
jgi:hypothetical protein